MYEALSSEIEAGSAFDHGAKIYPVCSPGLRCSGVTLMTEGGENMPKTITSLGIEKIGRRFADSVDHAAYTLNGAPKTVAPFRKNR